MNADTLHEWIQWAKSQPQHPQTTIDQLRAELAVTHGQLDGADEVVRNLTRTNVQLRAELAAYKEGMTLSEEQEIVNAELCKLKKQNENLSEGFKRIVNQRDKARTERDAEREELASKQGTIDMLWGQLRYHREKPAPHCPKCHRSALVHVFSLEGDFYCRCGTCLTMGKYYKSIDAALDAWRPEGGGK